MSEQNVFGKSKVSMRITVTDPDGTITHFDEERSKQDMGTPESRKAAADKLKQKQFQESN